MDGILIINKEKGWTSNDVVQKVKHMVGEKVGHTGTLDPMAQGVLPLLIGKGTEISKYLINHDKEYDVTLKLGIRTSTADSEGEVLEEKNVKKENLKEENVKKVLESFVGKNIQTPPIYSAIKVKGKKLYEYARKGQKVEIPKREIEIYNITLKDIIENQNEIKFNVSCSKGTYIRSLAEDIANKLETVGFMKKLNRIKVGEFEIKDAVKISDLSNNIEEYIITIEEFFKNNEKIFLNDKELKLFLNGVKIDKVGPDDIYKIYQGDRFIGMGVIQNNKLKRDIIL